MNNKEFIPYQEALDLKELGFNEPCFGFYTEEYKTLIKNFCKYPINLPTKPFLAPTYSQAFRWFDENTEYQGFIIPSIKENMFDWSIIEDGSEVAYCQGYFENRQEAELDCLKKLIEIVKNT